MFCFSFQTTEQFFAEYNQQTPSVFRSARAPFAYEAMWAIAVTLERARPILSDWNLKLNELEYGRTMVSQLLKEEAFETKFTGPSVGEEAISAHAAASVNQRTSACLVLKFRLKEC